MQRVAQVDTERLEVIGETGGGAGIFALKLTLLLDTPTSPASSSRLSTSRSERPRTYAPMIRAFKGL
jgi:hypothetical protein